MFKSVQWSNANRLSLNIEKTNFMIFRPRGKNEVCPTIHICGAEIQEVESAKFLGIMVDNKLNWMERIKCISRKLAKGIGIIIKARKSFKSVRHYFICIMHWYFLIFHTVFKFGEQLPLFIYIDYMFYRKRLLVLSVVFILGHTQSHYINLWIFWTLIK